FHRLLNAVLSNKYRQKIAVFIKNLSKYLFYSLSCIFQQDRRENLQSRLLNDPRSFLCIGALKPDDDGHLDIADFFIRFHHTVRNAVTPYDAAEDVDQYSLNVRVFEDNSESGLYGFSICTSAYVEEVGRFSTG